MSIVVLAAGILATWRLTMLFVSESGPLLVFERLREWAALRSPFLHSLLDCFWCTSVWMGAAIAVLIAQDAREWVLMALACSGGAVVMNILLPDIGG